MQIKKVIGKKIWSLILVVVMVMGLLPQMTIPVQAAVVADSNFQTVTNSDGTATITKVTNPGSTLEFPSVIGDSVVTAIGDKAFMQCIALQTVSFAADSALKTIGVSAFMQCTALKEIEIPAGVTSIGDAAFGYCTALKNADFAPDSKLESIGGGAFLRCTGLIEVVFGICLATEGFTVLDLLDVLKTAGDSAIAIAVERIQRK